MGIFINNLNRRRELEEIYDLQNQINTLLSNPNIDQSVKDWARSSMASIPTYNSDIKSNKLERAYTIDRLRGIATTLNEHSVSYKEDIPAYTGPRKTIVRFDPALLEDPLEVQGLDPDKKYRATTFAKHLSDQLKIYENLLAQDDKYALEDWKTSNSTKIGQWLLGLVLKDDMKDPQLDTLIARIMQIVGSLQSPALTASANKWLSVFASPKPESERPLSPEEDNAFTINGTTFTKTKYPGYFGKIFEDLGYTVGKSGDLYYLFDKFATLAMRNQSGYEADPTKEGFNQAWSTNANGLIFSGNLDDPTISTIGDVPTTAFLEKIINEYKLKFPIEYYSPQGGKNIIDFSNYFKGDDLITHDVADGSFDYTTLLNGGWDAIFSNIDDWKNLFQYSGNLEGNTVSNPSALNLYGTQNNYILGNPKLPTKDEIANNDSYDTIMNSISYVKDTTGLKALFTGNHLTELSLVNFIYDYLSAAASGDDAKIADLNNYFTTPSILIDNLELPSVKWYLFGTRNDIKEELKTKFKGDSIPTYRLVFDILSGDKAMYTRLLNRILSGQLLADKPDAKLLAYHAYQQLSNPQPVVSQAKGGTIKFLKNGGGDDASTATDMTAPLIYYGNAYSSTPVYSGTKEPYSSEYADYTWTVDDWNERWANRTAQALNVGDPTDTYRGKMYDSFTDMIKDPDVYAPLLLRATSLLVNMGAAGASNAVGPGTIAAGVLGLASTGLDYVADLKDPTVTTKLRRQNLGFNLGMVPVGMIPDAKFLTSAVLASKIIKPVLMTAKSAGYFAALAGTLGLSTRVLDRVWELCNNPDSRQWTLDDATLMLYTLNSAARGIGAIVSNKSMKGVQKAATSPDTRDVPFVGTDGLEVMVKMTQAQYENYLNSGYGAKRGSRNTAALKEAETMAGLDQGSLSANKVVNFDKYFLNWPWLRKAPAYEPTVFNWPPKPFNFLNASVDPKMLNIDDAAAFAVRYTTGYKKGATNAPASKPIPVKGKPYAVEVINGTAVRRDWRGYLPKRSIHTLDLNLPFSSSQHPKKSSVPKEAREYGISLSASDVTETFSKFNTSIPNGLTPKGGIAYDNKLYWWKNGGKLSRLSNYLLTK